MLLYLLADDLHEERLGIDSELVVSAIINPGCVYAVNARLSERDSLAYGVVIRGQLTDSRIQVLAGVFGIGRRRCCRRVAGDG